jgi:glycosyltransferase involved in cell wall biosynthesis
LAIAAVHCHPELRSRRWAAVEKTTKYIQINNSGLVQIILPEIVLPCKFPVMRIVHVVTSTNLGGAQVMLQRYLLALGATAAEHLVISLLPDGPIAQSIAATGAPVRNLGLKRGRVTPQAIWRLRSELRLARPDVVHGWMYHGCLAGWAGLAGVRSPARVWSIHHSLQDMANQKRAPGAALRVLSRLSPRVDLITYCSGAAQAQHEAIGFDGTRAVLIPNGVDTEVFRPDAGARARLSALCGIPEGRLIVGNVARSHPMKSHETTVRAIAHLLEWGHDIHAVIIGEGHRGGPAALLARSLGIAHRVSALDARDDVAALVPGFDVFLLSSAWGEACPLAVAEAMAAEVVCVVTNVGDCAMLVGDTGIVVPPNDPVAQAHAVAGLIEAGSGRRAEIGRRARERVAALFSMTRYVDRYEEAYAQARETRRSCTSSRPSQA